MEGEELISVLGNKYNTEILSAAGEPKSAKELSEQLDVPIATCYRRIDELEQAKLLELHDRTLSEDRRRVKVYRRCVDRIDLDFRDGISVEMTERTTVKDRLDDVWRQLSSESD